MEKYNGNKMHISFLITTPVCTICRPDRHLELLRVALDMRTQKQVRLYISCLLFFYRF
jgi:hypothetical protein